MTLLRAAAAFLPLTLSTAAFAQAPTLDDVPFAQVGTQPLVLDLYLPAAGKAPYPLVVWVHGGGWQSGTHDGIPPAVSQLIPQGFAVASVQYRLTSEAGLYGPGVPVIFPAQIQDVKGAVRWLRAHAATFNVDPARFGAFGPSAGGHLVALLATSGGAPALEGSVGDNLAWSSRVQAVVDFFGPTDLLHINDDVTTPPGSTLDHDAPSSPESKLIGFSQPGQGLGVIKANLANPSPPFPQLLALLAQANPISWVEATDPPAFIAHGTADTTVPMTQSTKLANALAAAGVPSTYVQVPGAGHGFLGLPTEQAAQAFLVAQLGDATQHYTPALSTLQPIVPVGGTLTVQIDAKFPGDAWVVFYGELGIPTEIPPFGTMWLDLAQPKRTAALGSLPPGATWQQVAIPIPDSPALHGAMPYLQCLVGGGAGGATTFTLSNVLKVTIP